MTFMRMEQVKRLEAGLFIDVADRPVGAYWVKLKATGEMVPAVYDVYDATEEVDLAALPDGESISTDFPVWGFGWSLNQDPEEEWRLIPESEFEYIGPKIPSEEQIIATQRLLHTAENVLRSVIP